jgi:aldehyde dehydrogenase (NAD+)
MNPFQNLFDAQKAYFANNGTRSYAWRLEQLDRMGKMIKENEAALQRAIARDFKTVSQEYIFETAATFLETEYQKSQLQSWMTPTEAPVPKALAKTGHKGMVYRDPYGVILVIGPSNGPLTLLLRPAIAALTAGNTCVLKLSPALSATSAVLLELVPKYFDPRAVSAVAGNREETTELLKLPFDFIFFTGSTKVGKVVARAAAENLTPVLLELGGQNPAVVDQTANIRDRRSSGGPPLGADNGVRRWATPTYTNRSPTRSFQKPKRRLSSSMDVIPRTTRTTRVSSAPRKPRGFPR